MNNIIKIVLLFLAFGLFHCSARAQTKSSLLWGTYFGGDSTTSANGVFTDDSGNVYVTGFTYSDSGIATFGAYQASNISIYYSSFLAKFSPSGNLLWGTYYGGSNDNEGESVVIDKAGNIYITGITSSNSGIATPGAYQTSFRGGSYDAFLAKFDPSGSLIWATYYGGKSDDQSFYVATDNAENVYISGFTSSDSGIATSGAYQTSYAGGGDAFLAKFSSSGNLLWATYYGGSKEEEGDCVATDKSGYIYLSGYTASDSGIATSGAYQTSYSNGGDAFLAKFNPSGSLQWSTYYGGKDEGVNVAIDISGNAYISGSTYATTGIATSGAYQTSYGGGPYDAFIAKFNSADSLLWATYYGGSGDEEAGCIATDKFGNVYITGWTSSTSGIATSGAYQTSQVGNFDTYLAKFSSGGNLFGATYYGESGTFGGAVAVDTYGNIYSAGETGSTYGIATSGAYQTSCNDMSGAAFLAKFSFSTLTDVAVANTFADNINIFPNPSINTFNIHMSVEYSDKEDVCLTDILGHQVAKFELTDKNEFLFNASDYGLKNGIFILTIHLGNNIFTRKLVVE